MKQSERAPVQRRTFRRLFSKASAALPGLLLGLLGSLAPVTAFGSGPDDSAAQPCQMMMGGRIELCAQRIERYPNGASQWIRIHLFESYTGASPHNEYFIWQTCGETEYRIVSREPRHLPTVRRTKTVDATGESELHRSLRFFGKAACEVGA